VPSVEGCSNVVANFVMEFSRLLKNVPIKPIGPESLVEVGLGDGSLYILRCKERAVD
jgi:hypothetical protein